jgi:probable HAF family extracellular repeat protein
MRRQRRLSFITLGLWLAAASNILADNPEFTTIDYPGAAATQAQGINARGDIVGFYTTAGVTHGFLLSEGNFTTTDFPGASATFPYGINDRGDTVGSYVIAGVTHGFLLSGGNFTTIDLHGATSTETLWETTA